MDTLQGLSYLRSTVNTLHLSQVYRMLRDVSHGRCRLVMRLLVDGHLNVTELERMMYRSGDTTITQTEVSRTISMLMRHRMIRRVFPDGMSRTMHYYELNHKRIRKVQGALDRFFNNG